MWDFIGKDSPSVCEGFEVAAPGGATLVARLTRVRADARAQIVLRRPGQTGEQRLFEACLPYRWKGTWVRAGEGEAVGCTLGAKADWHEDVLWWYEPGEVSQDNLAAVALGGDHYLVAWASEDEDGTLMAAVDVAAPNRYGTLDELTLGLGLIVVGEEGASVHAIGGRPRAARTAWLDARGNDMKILKHVLSYESGGVRAEMSEADAPWNPYGLTMTELDLTDLATGRTSHIANAPVRGEAALKSYVDGGYALSYIGAEASYMW